MKKNIIVTLVSLFFNFVFIPFLWVLTYEEGGFYWMPLSCGIQLLVFLKVYGKISINIKVAIATAIGASVAIWQNWYTLYIITLYAYGVTLPGELPWQDAVQSISAHWAEMLSLPLLFGAGSSILFFWDRITTKLFDSIPFNKVG